jgi:hypothetical protein
MGWGERGRGGGGERKKERGGSRKKGNVGMERGIEGYWEKWGGGR